MFLKNYLLLTKPAFIWSKIQQKQWYCELSVLFKITAFYFNILSNGIDCCDPRISNDLHVISKYYYDKPFTGPVISHAFYSSLKSSKESKWNKASKWNERSWTESCYTSVWKRSSRPSISTQILTTASEFAKSYSLQVNTWSTYSLHFKSLL